MNLCVPLIIYSLFCLIQILIDLLEGLYNSAVIKLVISILVSGVLYFLCAKDFLLTAWVIVLVPFLFMSLMTSVVLYQLKSHDALEESCEEELYIKKTILNEPRYKHGYTHLYKYTTTPVKMRFEPIRECEEDDDGEDGDEEEGSKNRYFLDSDPEYESFK
jgi:hypothetical protein